MESLGDDSNRVQVETPKLAIALSVVVVDDRPLVIAGLERLFRKSDITVAAHTHQGDEAVQKIMAHRPDVVLLEVRIGGHDNLDAITRILESREDQAIIVFSSYENSIYVARAIALGARNFISKREQANALIQAIRDAANGVPPDERSTFGRVKGMMDQRSNSDDPGYSLTRREMQVLRHIALGLSNREIAKALKISLETVKEHVQNVLRKTNAADRTQAAVLAIKLQLV